MSLEKHFKENLKEKGVVDLWIFAELMEGSVGRKHRDKFEKGLTKCVFSFKKTLFPKY